MHPASCRGPGTALLTAEVTCPLHCQGVQQAPDFSWPRARSSAEQALSQVLRQRPHYLSAGRHTILGSSVALPAHCHSTLACFALSACQLACRPASTAVKERACAAYHLPCQGRNWHIQSQHTPAKSSTRSSMSSRCYSPAVRWHAEE